MKNCKKVKLTDVADAAQVSVATVSRVINNNGYVSEDVRQNVWDAIHKTGYEVKKGGEPQNKEKLIGIILKRLPVNMFFETMNGALLRAAEREGMQAITVFCDSVTSSVVREQAEKLLSHRVCGIVVAGFQEASLEREVCKYLMHCGVPVIFVERLADSRGFNQVCIDNNQGSYLAARHLIERGHKKIVYIGRAYVDNDRGSRRLDGFMRAINEAKQPLEYLIKDCNTPDAEEGYRAMLEAEKELPGFTGVQAWYDGYLIGVMRYLYERGIHIPDEVELMGNDDTYSALLSPPVSSVQLPFDEMARAALQMIVEWQDTSVEHFVRTINLEPKLMLRGL